jgi:hypothetical protein
MERGSQIHLSVFVYLAHEVVFVVVRQIPSEGTSLPVGLDELQQQREGWLGHAAVVVPLQFQ